MTSDQPFASRSRHAIGLNVCTAHINISARRMIHGGLIYLRMNPDLASKEVICIFSFVKNQGIVSIHDTSVKKMLADQVVSVFGVVSFWVNAPIEMTSRMLMWALMPRVIRYQTDKLAVCRNTETTRNHIGMQGHKYHSCKQRVESRGNLSSWVYETFVPSVEHLIFRIPATNGRIRDMPGIFKNVSDHDRHVMSSSPVPLKIRLVGERCTLNLSRAQRSSRWCGVVVRRGVPAQVSSTSLDHGSKLRGMSPKALV
ncbi:uncharacterized protein TNCV_2390351 [Trichonephila clavipes]|nr:uncharacterized protein TNCV_2390351 [Trichonephila clavipes]